MSKLFDKFDRIYMTIFEPPAPALREDEMAL